MIPKSIFHNMEVGQHICLTWKNYDLICGPEAKAKV